MKRYLFVCFAALWACLTVGQAMGQSIGENTITVMGNANVDVDADWAEVNLALHGQGPSAQEAVFNCADVCNRVSVALQKEGVPKESIRFGAPRISRSYNNYGQMEPGDPRAEANRFSVANTLTIRINKVNVATVYDDIAKLMDAVSAVKGVEPGGRAMEYMGQMSNSDTITFGVNDPKPLRARAMTEALDDARQLAEVAAAGIQKKLGPLAMLSSVRWTASGQVSPYGGPSAPSKPARAVVSVNVMATYKLQ